MDGCLPPPGSCAHLRLEDVQNACRRNDDEEEEEEEEDDDDASRTPHSHGTLDFAISQVNERVDGWMDERADGR